MSSILNVRDVSKRFPLNGSEMTALENVSFSARNKEFVSVIGQSGSGKTTMLKIIANLLKGDSGEIKIAGKTTEEARKERLSGFVFQDFVLFPWRTVYQNVKLPLEINGMKEEEIRKRTEEAISLVDLTEFKNSFPSQLSGGMKQKVAIARALASKPAILLMDEPFGSLDELTRNQLNLELLNIFEKPNKDLKTVVFVTHSIEEAIFLSDKVVVFSESPGKVKEVIPIELPRPRKVEIKDSKQFFELKKKIRGVLEARQ